MSPGMIPLFLKVEGRPVLVVGGGTVALRKVEWLVASGASVEVLSPRFDPPLQALAVAIPDRIALLREPFSDRALSRYLLVIAATGQREVNQAVAACARRDGVLINVVDEPESCSFYVPATLQRGDLQIAVSTAGECPSLARRIRAELEEVYPEYYGRFTAALGKARRWLRESCPDPAERNRIIQELASLRTAQTLREFDQEAMAQALIAQAQSLLQKS